MTKTGIQGLKSDIWDKIKVFAIFVTLHKREYMKDISAIHKRLLSQVLFFTIVPAFFIAFILVYSPFGSEEYLDAGRGLYSLDVTILTCITLVCLALTRVAFHFIFRKLKITWTWYIAWCVGEIIVISMFQALYMCLIYKGTIPYFTVLGSILGMCALTMVIPYALIILSLEVNAQNCEVGTRLEIDDTGTLDLLSGLDLVKGDVVTNFYGMGDQSVAWNALKTRVTDSSNPKHAFKAVYDATADKTYFVSRGKPLGLVIIAR